MQTNQKLAQRDLQLELQEERKHYYRLLENEKHVAPEYLDAHLSLIQASKLRLAALRRELESTKGLAS